MAINSELISYLFYININRELLHLPYRQAIQSRLFQYATILTVSKILNSVHSESS